MARPVLEANTPTFAPERPVSPEVKVDVLLARGRDLDEVEPGGLEDEGKVNVRWVNAPKTGANHNARSNFFQLDDAIPWYPDASAATSQDFITSAYPAGQKSALPTRCQNALAYAHQTLCIAQARISVQAPRPPSPPS
jgi:hypothetical protein